MNAAVALRLSLVALALSLLAFAVHAASAYFHAPVPLPQRVLTSLGAFGLTWPLWAYAAAMYRRAASNR